MQDHCAHNEILISVWPSLEPHAMIWSELGRCILDYWLWKVTCTVIEHVHLLDTVFLNNF